MSAWWKKNDWAAIAKTALEQVKEGVDKATDVIDAALEIDSSERHAGGSSEPSGGYYDPELGAFVGGPEPAASDSSAADGEPIKLNLDLPVLPDVFGSFLKKKAPKSTDAPIADLSITDIVPKDDSLPQAYPNGSANETLAPADSWSGDWIDTPNAGKSHTKPAQLRQQKQNSAKLDLQAPKSVLSEQPATTHQDQQASITESDAAQATASAPEEPLNERTTTANENADVTQPDDSPAPAIAAPTDVQTESAQQQDPIDQLVAAVDMEDTNQPQGTNDDVVSDQCPMNDVTGAARDAAGTNHDARSETPSVSTDAVLEQREIQVMHLSDAYGKLQSENEKIAAEHQSLLNKLHAAHVKEAELARALEGFKALKDEHQTCEKTIQGLRGVIDEKEEEVAGLLAEGTALSKAQHLKEQAIKQLRAELRDAETKTATVQATLLDKEKQLAQLTNELASLKAKERNISENAQRITDVADTYSKDIVSLRRECAVLKDEKTSLQAQLDSLRLDTKATVEALEQQLAEARSSATQAETQAREKLQEMLDRERTEAHTLQQSLKSQIDELNKAVFMGEELMKRREEQLYAELEVLRNKLADHEHLSSDVAGEVVAATRPLLRQIEQLQQHQAEQQDQWESLEMGLVRQLDEANAKLSDAEQRTQEAIERESAVAERLQRVQQELQDELRRQTQISDDAGKHREQLESLRNQLDREMQQSRALKAAYDGAVEELKEQKEEQARLIASLRDKNDALLAQLKTQTDRGDELQEELSRRHDSDEIRPIASHNDVNMTQSHGRDTPEPPRRTPTHAGIVAGSMDFSGSAPDMEGFSATAMAQMRLVLKQRDGEIAFLQQQVRDLEASRTALADELAETAADAATLQHNAGQVTELTEQLKDMESKYSKLLQMYGALQEVAEERRLDLMDIKEVYKHQIDHLVSQLNHQNIG